MPDKREYKGTVSGDVNEKGNGVGGGLYFEDIDSVLCKSK